MTISLKTHKQLWGRSGNMCAFENCRMDLVEDFDFGDSSIIGEEAHIVAKKKNGPRGNDSLPINKRDEYDNLILLCRNHHKIIDDQPEIFTIEVLKSLKKNHVDYVRGLSSTLNSKLSDEEDYANIIDEINRLIEIKTWQNWTSQLLIGIPFFPSTNLKKLRECSIYILSRVWPKRYPDLENAIINFRLVLEDLILVMHRYPRRSSDGIFVDKFYSNYYRENYSDPEEFDQARVEEHILKYYYHIALIGDLTLELTRALNHLSNQVRKYISTNYRKKEGVSLVVEGEVFSGTRILRCEYSDVEQEKLYPGLLEFMEERSTRDYSLGKGVSDDYLN